MNNDQRVGLLKDEYVMLQQFYEDMDGKGLNIKNWAITVALATIGAGVVYHKALFLVGFAAALVFWYLEAYWRGLSHFFVTRIREIETAFEDGSWKKKTPLQVYSSWDKEFSRSGDQTIQYMLKQSSFLPHVIIAAINLILFFWSGEMFP